MSRTGLIATWGSILLLHSAFCWSQQPQAESGRQPTVTQRGPEDQILDKYSIEQLRSVLVNRRNKTLTDTTPPEVKNVRSESIVDNIIYRQKSIYGADRRKDFYEIQDPKELSVANSVVAFVPAGKFQESQSSIKLLGKSLGEEERLCSGEHYFAQPALVAYCTGFVVGPDLIATAGHCVPSASDMNTVRIVFGYRVTRNGDAYNTTTEIPKSEVYVPVAVVSRKQDDNGLDYAVLRVDRRITDHIPLPLHLDGTVAVGDELYVVGHPTGLPLKLADRGFVRSVSSQGYFVSNLDTFGGNSGSPVLRAGTVTVEGILVRGDTDYVAKDYCQVAFTCPSTGCRGEDATEVSYIASTVKSGPMATQERQPITKTFSSGLALSGAGGSFSQEYTVTSDPAPPGYKIANFSYSLNGDRACNAWSTCRASIENDRAVFRFTLQGHNEWPFPGQGTSIGNVVVTYAPQ
jgi:hypothetical protein